MIERKNQKLVITLDNVNQANAIALIKMFKYMQFLGSAGCSRMCSFFADGDGSFHPKFTYEYPEELPEVPEEDGVVDGADMLRIKEGTKRIFRCCEGDFIIDSDSIAWKIYH
jgi:hypothetical protein